MPLTKSINFFRLQSDV